MTKNEFILRYIRSGLFTQEVAMNNDTGLSQDQFFQGMKKHYKVDPPTGGLLSPSHIAWRHAVIDRLQQDCCKAFDKVILKAFPRIIKI